MPTLFRHGKRVGIAIAGGLVVLIGLILIPYPGPGWLIVFAGLAILATEFEFAAKALTRLRHKYDSWTAWLKRQPQIIKVLVLAFTGLVILVTVWLLNTFWLIDNFLQLHQQWLYSPLIKK